MGYSYSVAPGLQQPSLAAVLLLLLLLHGSMARASNTKSNDSSSDISSKRNKPVIIVLGTAGELNVHYGVLCYDMCVFVGGRGRHAPWLATHTHTSS